MKRRTAFLLPVPVCLLTALTLPAVQDYGSKYFEPTAEVVTPHIAWARPNSRGPLKVLFITYRQAMREVVEIGQRLEMEAEVFVLHLPGSFVAEKPAIAVVGENAEDEAARLAGKLNNDFDLIVLAQIRWTELPLPSRVAILASVKAGTGLLARLLEGEAPYLDKALKGGLWSPERNPLPGGLWSPERNPLPGSVICCARAAFLPLAADLAPILPL